VSRWRATVVAVLIVGCRTPTPSEVLHGETSAERSLERADDLSRDSHPREARALYEEVLRGHPDATSAAHALYGLGRLAVAPGPQQDYRAARVSFERLLAKYPDCQWAADATAWRAVLRQLEHSEAQRVDLQEEIERLKQFDMEQERHR
jgi:outer membrane protein assembly factor BamD (BamD/ComL family)